MSTTHDPKIDDELDQIILPIPTPADPYPLGWRHTVKHGKDGTPDSWRVALTEFDLLHPKIDDVALPLPSHVADCAYLQSVFRTRLADRPDVAVLSDAGLDLNLPATLNVAPDVAVVLGVPATYDGGILKMGRRRRARIALIVEVTSPSSRRNDLRAKVGLYAAAGVPFYIIVDVGGSGEERTLSILGHRLTPEGYERISLDDQDRLPLGELLNLRLGQEERRLVCYDEATGAPLGNYQQIAEDLAVAEARAAAEAQGRSEAEARAAAAEARTRELEAEIRRLRGGG